MHPGTKTAEENLPLISIIIPVYNNERFVEESIRSAMSQTWPNKEIIVIDDGSSDNSYAIARRFESRDVRVYRQENRGACAARNHGFARSTGSYIQYLDADDLLSPEKIAVQIKRLLEEPGDTLANCAWGRFTDTPAEAVFTEEPVWKISLPVDWLISAWTGGGMMQTACWLTPRHVIEQAGPWNETFRMNPNDDGEFFCRVLLKSGGIRYCAGAKVYYRHYEGARVSTQTNRTAVESLLRTCQSYEENIRQTDFSPPVIEAVCYNYASFIYKYYNMFPDLAAIAEQRIRALGIKKIPLTGGRSFRKAAALLGFKNVLRLRGAFKKF